MKKTPTGPAPPPDEFAHAPDEPEPPAGDSPPRPAWPLVVGVSVWVLWIGFLLVMMAVRMQTTAV